MPRELLPSEQKILDVADQLQTELDKLLIERGVEPDNLLTVTVTICRLWGSIEIEGNVVFHTELNNDEDLEFNRCLDAYRDWCCGVMLPFVELNDLKQE